MKKFLLLLLLVPLTFACKKAAVTYSYTLNKTVMYLHQNDSDHLQMINHGSIDTLAEFFYNNSASMATSDDGTWVASLYHYNSQGGSVVARHVGAAQIEAYGQDTTQQYCNVYVLPNYKLYTEPYFKRGTKKGVVQGTQSEVINYEDTLSVKRQGPYYSTDSLSMMYKGENANIENIVYNFKSQLNANGKQIFLDNVVVTLANTASIDDVKNFLGERYDLRDPNGNAGADGRVHYLSDFVQNLNKLSTYDVGYAPNANNTISVFYQWASN